MDGETLKDWLIEHSAKEASEEMGISLAAVYKMIKSGRNVRVIARDYDFLFIEIKELNR